MKRGLQLLSISLILFFDGNTQSNIQLDDFLSSAVRSFDLTLVVSFTN